MKIILRHAFDATIFTLLILLVIIMYAGIGKILDKLYKSIDLYGITGWLIVLSTIWILAFWISYKMRE